MGQSAPKTQNVTQTTNTAPWSGAQPALTQALSGAMSAFNAGMPGYYPGQTVAQMSPQTLAGLNAIQANAGASSTLANQALGGITDAMNPGALPGASNVGNIAEGGAPNPFAAFFSQQTGGANPFLGAIGAAGGASADTSALAPFLTGGANNPIIAQLLGAGGASADTSALAPFLTGGANNPFVSDVLSSGGASASGPGTSTLSTAATGGLMSNPFLDQTFQQGATDIRNQLDTAFARAGRGSGNGNFAAAYGKSLGDFGTQLFGQAYDQDMNRRMGAADTLAGYENAGLDRSFNAASTAAGLGDSVLGRQLSAAGTQAGFSNDALTRALQGMSTAGGLSDSVLGRQYDASTQLTGLNNDALTRALQAAGMSSDAFTGTRSQNLAAGEQGAGLYNDDLSHSIDSYLALAGQQNAQAGLGLQGAGMLPGVYDFSNAGAQNLLGVGSALEGYDQSLIGADMDRYNYGANADRNNVSWLNSIASGNGSLGGTSTQTGQVPYQASNPFLQGLGAVSSVASIAQMLPSIMAMFSDRRLKTDARPAGIDDKGQLWHAYRYLWDPASIERLGVMSDEIDPAFVMRTPGGFDVVDYSKVLA